LDNIQTGVNNRIADKLGLQSRRVLQPKTGQLMKLVTFVPLDHTEKVKNALFEAGAGQIGNYSETSFQTPGTGNFKGNEETHPFVGDPGKRHTEPEHRLETLFPFYLKDQVVKALFAAHPYEEIAYDIISLSNDNQSVGSGLLGVLPEPMEETGFLHMLKTSFGLSVIRHTPFLGKKIQKVAICGGSGSFLTGSAIRAGADIYVTSDIKYHEFFDANAKILLADIGHWESEQFTTELLIELLQAKFPTFAVLKSEVKTNPVNYFLG
ncbi:MAG: Nif3-like dinuclear metal center hexameric protein, partial [Bacteroidota bacterium]|nr:Nif3-like dinuclear metal center hexameric protein [Bacteroidota bacterium]